MKQNSHIYRNLTTLKKCNFQQGLEFRECTAVCSTEGEDKDKDSPAWGLTSKVMLSTCISTLLLQWQNGKTP